MNGQVRDRAQVDAGRTDALVVGGGPAGLTAAIALASAGVTTALLAPPYAQDSRTTALLGSSITALDALGVWPLCREYAQAMRHIRLIDDRGGLFRAPETLFHSTEIGREAFGYNIENRHLVAALGERAAALPALRIHETTAESIDGTADGMTVVTADGRRITAALVAAADGAHSRCRIAAGIDTETWAYPQVALTCNLSHARPHGDASTEFHTAHGPCTLVPLPGNQSSLVWLVSPQEAERLTALDDPAFAAAVHRQVHAILGRMTVASARHAFPMRGQTATRLAANRIALIGEAAHVFAPIGAQGLNLSLRDAATLAELAGDAARLNQDIGSPDLLRRYEARRAPDVRSRSTAVDLLNRSLLTDFVPLQGLRGLGLSLIAGIAPLRRALMREGIEPRLDVPRLMRGEPL